jgi:Mor family transcriptional regulator
MSDEQLQLLDPMTCDPLDLLLEHHADLPPPARWPKLLRELVDIHAAYNERVWKLTAKQAADDAIERVVLLAQYLGGRFVYLPRGDELRIAARDALIYRLSDRQPAHEIAKLFGLGEHVVYRIIARQRALVVDRLQGKLFE